MTRKGQWFRSAAYSVVQTATTGVILFVLYGYLLRTIGADQLGIWSLLLATTAVSRVSDLGLSASVVKFVAKYKARGEHADLNGVIQTAALSVGTLVGVVVLVTYPFVGWVLGHLVPVGALGAAHAILPYALTSLWITSITAVFQAGLDGCRRFDLRSALIVAAGVFHLVLCFLLVPWYGLQGLAYAQVLQCSLVCLGSWLLLRRELPGLPLTPCRWRRDLFSEMLGYGIEFQVIAVANLLYDPLTKALLAKFGDLAMVGYYEMASRMIVQVRALIVSAAQTVVPIVADMQERSSEGIQLIYSRAYQLLAYISLPLYSMVIAGSPIISELWIGRYERSFALFVMLLGIGWFLNTLNAPAYFVTLGTGELRWNTIGHVAIALVNGCAGILLGKIFGGTGVVVAWVSSLALGSGLITVAYHVGNGVPIRALVPKESERLALASAGGVLVALMIYYAMRVSSNLQTIVSLIAVAFGAIVGIPAWTHPMRARLNGWITQSVSKTMDAR